MWLHNTIAVLTDCVFHLKHFALLCYGITLVIGLFDVPDDSCEK